jgi:hypothetical protein
VSRAVSVLRRSPHDGFAARRPNTVAVLSFIVLQLYWPVEKVRHDVKGCMNQFGRVSHAARIEVTRARIAKPISIGPGLVSGIAPRTAKSKPTPPAPLAWAVSGRAKLRVGAA